MRLPSRRFMFPPQFFHRVLFGLGTLLLGVSAARASSVSAPYSQNFDGYTPGNVTTDFTESSTTSWTVVNQGVGDNAFQVSFTGAPANRTASVDIVALSGQDHFASTEFTIGAIPGSANPANIALVAASASDLSGGSNYRLIYTVTSGTLSIQEGTTTIGAAVVPLFGVSLTATYTMSLQVAYVGGAAQLSGTMTSSEDPDVATISRTDTSVLQTGAFFGYRVAWAATGTPSETYTVQFDNFSVGAVPEPSVAVFLLGGLGVLGLRRRRRA